MIYSMTGYGRGEASIPSLTSTVEIRSVNGRFLDIGLKLPRLLMQRENELKEIIRSKVARGKVTVSISVERTNGAELPIRIDKEAARAHYKLLADLKKTLKLKEKISLEHMLHFSEVFESGESEELTDSEWVSIVQAVRLALDDFNNTRRREGEELSNDLRQRVEDFSIALNEIERLSRERIPQERTRLQQRVQELIQDRFVVDMNRLELEVSLLAEKLDVTEECVRFRSHNKFFLDALENDDAAGRKLNFLVQEINREANTIGSKSNDATIAHLVVKMKEDLEKIREQLQNIE